jgi:hypothetical protein
LNGFINSPALAKLIALQLVDEQIQRSRQSRPHTTSRVSLPARLRARLLARRTTRRAATPAPGARAASSGKLVEEGR